MAKSHGTPAMYASGCNCDVCTDENTRRNRVSQAKRAVREPDVHNANTYRNWACRCPVCVAAHKEDNRQRTSRVGRGPNHRKAWTSQELEVALAMKDGRRYQFTAEQVAIALGRSLSGVNQQRHLARVQSETETPAPAGK